VLRFPLFKQVLVHGTVVVAGIVVAEIVVVGGTVVVDALTSAVLALHELVSQKV